ncbi:MAG: dTMP kinase [Candidatus Gottesmanbacteria bacterium]|nr:dTMP kinase [Candidatus Gottesmanbacteria bacterium]
MKRGFFITIEGGEGAGKSIQVEILASHLREEGYPIVVTREPGGTRIGEQIRAITHNQENVDMESTTEAYLMAAARAQHVAQIIEPAIASGKIVLCDRYVDSSIAYQGYGRKLGADTIAGLNALAINGAKPDLTLLLSVTPEVGNKRRTKSAKTKDRLDLQQHDFYSRVHDGYLALAKKDPNRYVVIDAEKSIVQVAQTIWDEVHTRLPARNGKTKT